MVAERENTISKATASRMPAYLRFLKGEQRKGEKYTSSATVARGMGLTAISVRKDLALVSSLQGKPRIGYELSTLIRDIEKFLGYDRWTDAIVVGAGGLGRAILAYEGFENYGIHVLAAFDTSPEKVGALAGKPVYPMERLKEIAARHRVRVGILTVPRGAAQSACNELIGAGITAILSFAPVHLEVPEGISVKYEDLAVSLAELCAEIPCRSR